MLSKFNDIISSRLILPPPFDSYVGSKPYVFVSYAHLDNAVVYPEIKMMHQKGVRLWYDQGIEEGNEWPAEIQNALNNCAAFIVFLSKHAVDSVNVRNEINLALKKKKPLLVIFLEKTELLHGMELQLDTKQNINKSQKDYWDRVSKFLNTESQVFDLLKASEDKKKAGLNLDLVLVPAGKFKMGSPVSEKGRYNNETLHEVTITKPYYIGKYAVTQDQWELVMGSNPSATKGGNLPVTNVSWYDCQAFFKKLNASVDRGYRLPTEAEWEYACRAGTDTAYSFGELITEKNANFDSKIGKPVSVGSYSPNAFKLHEMHGNVCEWCGDWFNDYPSVATADPIGPETGKYLVIRGGSFDFIPSSTRSAYRETSLPSSQYNYLGFRLARTK